MPRRPAREVPRTFLFADLRGYTAYVERAGDAAAGRLLRAYREVVRRAVVRERGAEIKTEGDSFYVVFRSSAAAVRCALAIQRAAAHRRREPIPVGIGIHAGEATPFERQYVGGAVNVAARLAGEAAAGEVLVSETVRALVRTAVRVPFEDRGPLRLKGLAEPMRAYAIRVASAGAPPAVVAPTGRAMEAICRGDLDGAARIARALTARASVDEQGDALAALTLLAACRGDLEGALARTERLLAAGLRAPARSWTRLAYALRSWLYFLARQPWEARAELERALQRPGTSPEACLGLLLAVSLGGTGAHAEQLRQVAASCEDRAVAAACAEAADVLQGREGTADGARRPGGLLGGSLLGGLVQLQLSARVHGRVEPGLRSALSQSGADRLAEVILGAVQ